MHVLLEPAIVKLNKRNFELDCAANTGIGLVALFLCNNRTVISP
jgi:hypothetical protein